MINLRNYIYVLKSTWIRRLIINDSKYKTMFETKYSKVEDLINRGLDFARFLKTSKSNKFWNNVLEAWLVVCEKQIPTKFEDILSTNSWNNKELKINNKVIFYRHWFVCVDVLRPSQPSEVMSSAVSLPNHTFTEQA